MLNLDAWVIFQLLETITFACVGQNRLAGLINTEYDAGIAGNILNANGSCKYLPPGERSWSPDSCY